MNRDPKTYYNDILDCVARIGKLVEFDVALYRNIDSCNKEVSNKMDAVNELVPAYMLKPQDAIFYGAYRIAPPGQTGPRTLANVVTGFYLTPFPGSCALCISTSVRVEHPYRKRGVNKIGIQLRQAIAGFTGFKGLICTDKTHNDPSIRTIAGAGFKELYSLTNKRTKNQINLYIKELD